jgi:two-component system LytT family sensor kinase
MSFFSASFRNVKLVYALWWILWMCLHANILQRLGYVWRTAYIDSIVSNILLLLFCLTISNIIRYYQPSKTTAWKLVIWCFLAASLWVWCSQWPLKKFMSNDLGYLENLSVSLPIRFSIGFLMISCTVLITWVWEFVAFKNEDALRQSKAMALAKEAELNSLTQQLQPHFLFNSLNSINALITSKPTEARNMVQQLSDFLRGTLKKENGKPVKLSEELKHLEIYLEIEKVRFGHRLKTIFEIDKVEDFLLPPLILQPLLENAIKFGLYDTVGEVEIKIMAKEDNNQLKITIQNPFDSDTSLVNKGTGFGLHSVSRRLYLMYARHDLLHTFAKNGIYNTEIVVPQNNSMNV